ncbi:MAG TPA: PIG-L deacetylase family protein [Actinophytocola sp.]|uniref:PIG-L deacetylase family protein n=1 Tax=Actinophytocola sp. TaxID=1872138 RepID=UPI002DC024C1|nr:PIG-L deacetylase family protein [Actinophytocola sp.]HEU5476122.1 PIG-L deacetylase family protein [Actinophytocola sp.]
MRLTSVIVRARTSVNRPHLAARLRDRLAPVVVPRWQLAGRMLVDVGRVAECRGVTMVQRASRRILAVGAHPDDVEIGAGATLLAHRAAGDEVFVLTLSAGERGGTAPQRAAESQAAADLLGAQLFLGDLPDTEISAGKVTIDLIEDVIRRVRPDVVYTHSAHDTHQDHRAVHQAVLVAARSVATVVSFQSPSTTVEFRPTRFVDVSAHIRGKLDLLACFASQHVIRDYLADDLVMATARYWSRHAAVAYAEPFEVVRERVDLVTPAHIEAIPAQYTLSAA